MSVMALAVEMAGSIQRNQEVSSAQLDAAPALEKSVLRALLVKRAKVSNH